LFLSIVPFLPLPNMPSPNYEVRVLLQCFSPKN
jgi:hypothetical protein